jgi:hypothetical protein
MTVQILDAVVCDPAETGRRIPEAADARPSMAVAEPYDDSQQLGPARGIARGLMLSVPVWAAIALVLWFLG